MSAKRVTRYSSCGELGLPHLPPNGLACTNCISSITKAFIKGVRPKRIMKCKQPWAARWANHRELGYVLLHKKVNQYLERNDIESDVIVETNLKSTSKGKEIIGKDDINCTNSTANTTPRSSDTIPVESVSTQNSTGMTTLEQSVSIDDTEANNSNNNEGEETEEIVTVSSYHCITHKTKLAMLESKAAKYDAIMNQLSSNQYKGTELGNAMIGCASSIVPLCGHYGIATVLPFAIGSLLANAGVEFKVEDIVNSQPSNITIQQCVEQNAVNTMILTPDSICKNPNLYVSADKGNKKGNKNLAKFVCWYDIQEKEVKIFLLDIDCIDEHTNNIADAFTHLLRRLLPANLEISIKGQCTDSGGGGTKFALSKALEERHMDA